MCGARTIVLSLALHLSQPDLSLDLLSPEMSQNKVVHKASHILL